MNDTKETIHRLARDVLLMSRNTLTVNLRFMDSAISRLRLSPREDQAGYGCDGTSYFYNPKDILLAYQKSKELPARQYLHCVLHCIFRHMFLDKEVDERLWTLACDIAIENTINEMNLLSTASPLEERQSQRVRALKKEVRFITAEVLYHYFQGGNLSEDKLTELEELFGGDRHDLWYLELRRALARKKARQEDKDKGQESQDASLDLAREIIENMWKDVSEHIQMDLETFARERGEKARGLQQNLREVNRERYDYTGFLKKFAVRGEAMKINDDEFDYIFYTYGLQLYEKMPLIEPLEYKDTKKIREFVIAIDTSASTSGDLVQGFLQKTYNILKSTESFYSRVNLHIIQCDEQIQEDVKITCQEDFDAYLKNMTIKGLEGTDFRPVFAYVNQLIKEKEFENLRGLIYFTDGKGRYPKLQPDYQTAFVFIDEGFASHEVPVWAMKLVLRPEEIA